MNREGALGVLRLAVRQVLGTAPASPQDGGPAPVVVACSGGPDSLALLAATVAERDRHGRRVIGAVVDHGLQEGSAEHTAAVVRRMAGLGADETLSARVQVTHDGRGWEAAARTARYDVLGQVAASVGTDVVLLGHTLDDQAETVLLGLTRGSGGRSIAGMRRSFEVFHRPLLGVGRAVTLAACEELGVEPWHDPHNTDPRFTRARVRHTVLPMLETELGPGVAETLARTAELLRPDMEALDDLADLAYLEARVEDGLDVAALAGQPAAIVSRVVRLAALAAGSPASELFHVHVTGLVALLAGRVRGEIQLPGRVTARREGDRLRFGATAVES
ncbi:tRNA lysidine(34) synthetase TilS [Nocardioides sp.]|uniref:tRNA lysidine(34) synthetase TilS n=1 Tax=Nocardioides sp. TaxID=35761 RepID=UPI0035190CAD